MTLSMTTSLARSTVVHGTITIKTVVQSALIMGKMMTGLPMAIATVVSGTTVTTRTAVPARSTVTHCQSTPIEAATV